MKMSLPLSALAALLIVAFASISTPVAAQSAAPPTTLAALNKQFIEAFQQQDLAKATAYLAKDARLLVNGFPVLSSRDSLSTYWLKDSFGHTSNAKFMPSQMSGDATMGYATGYYTYDIKPGGEYPKGASAHGSYMTICRKVGATWQLAYIHIGEDALKANK